MSFAQPFSGYEILARIGAGSMGTVFKARQKHMNRIVALKVLKPSLARDSHYVDRLRREARIVGKLNHPNIVTGYDLGEEGGYHFFVMEFVEGKSLRQLLHEWGMFPEEQVLDVGIQVASALAHAYECGVIHRDVKPGNILIDDHGAVKLTDLGLAKGPTDITLTKHGATVGTPQYISPEQARDPQSVDVRSDLYSLGATLFHMATGTPPFRADAIGELITQVLHDRAPSARGINPAISDGLSLVIRKLLAKDPELRYQTPAELLRDLQRVRKAERPQVDLRALEDESSRAKTSRRGAWIAMAVGVVALLTAWVAWRIPGDSDPAGGDETAAFRREIQAEVAAAEGFRARLEVLRRRRDRHAGEAARAAIVDDEYQGTILELREAVHAFLASFRDGVPPSREDWFSDPGHWAQPERYVGDVIVPELESRFGYPPLLLPDDLLRASVAVELDDLRRRFAAIAATREAEYLTRFDTWIDVEVRPAVQRELRFAQFAAAERELDDRLAAFHGTDGRPAREQLPPRLRAEVDIRRDAVATALRRDIRVARDDATRVLRDAIEQGVAAARRIAADIAQSGGSPDTLREQIDRLERELVRDHPGRESFDRADVDPWPEAFAAIAGLRTEHAALERRFEEKVLDDALGLAYRVAFAVSTADAIRVLEAGGGRHEDVDALRVRHRDLLRRAGRFAEEVVGAVLGDKDELRIDARRSDSGVTQSVVLRRAADRTLEVLRGDAHVPMPIADLDLESLLRHGRVGPAQRRAIEADAELREGRAFWLFASGRPEAAIEFLDAAQLRFCQEQCWPRFQLIGRGERSRADDEARAVFARVQHARRIGDHEGARQLLAMLDERFPGVAATAGFLDLRADVEAWISREVQRADLRARLTARGGADVSIQVGEDRAVRADYLLHARPAGVWPPGWRAATDHLEFETPDDRADGGARELVLPNVIPDDADTQLLLRIQLGGVGPDTEVLVVEHQGVAIAFVALPGGLGAARVIPPDASVGRGDRLRAELQEAVLGASRSSRSLVVPGAIHELRVRVSPGRRTSTVGVELDGVELVRDTAPRAPGDGRIVVRPYQRFALWSARLSASEL